MDRLPRRSKRQRSRCRRPIRKPGPNDQVHIWAISGKTDPLNPDTDGDDLSDGLELGWGTAVGDTNVNTDTNGDGVPNFQPDLDPPVYNTTDNGSPPAGEDYSFFDPVAL